MKVAIPTMGDGGLDAEIGGHFGKVPHYTIVDTETNEIEIVENTSEHVVGGSGLPPEIIAQTGANVMVVSGAGIRAIQLLNQYGIQVYTGASGTVRQIIEDLKAGVLDPTGDSNACNELNSQ